MASSTGPVASMRSSPPINCRTGLRVFADETPSQVRPAIAEQRPDFRTKVAHSAEVGVVFQVSRKIPPTPSSTGSGKGVQGMVLGYIRMSAPGRMLCTTAASFEDVTRTWEKCGSQWRSSCRDARGERAMREGGGARFHGRAAAHAERDSILCRSSTRRSQTGANVSA